jgi:thiol:disulfide interchange protein DsbD
VKRNPEIPSWIRRALKTGAVAFVLSCLLLNPVNAETFDSIRDVAVEFIASADGIPAGQSLDVAVLIRVPEKYHIASLETGNFFVAFDSVVGLHLGEPIFPQGSLFQDERVFRGEVVVRARVTAAADAEPGPRTLKATIGYQICSEEDAFQCFFPVEREVTLALLVVSAGTQVQFLHSDIFGGVGSNAEEPPSESSGGDLTARLETALAQGSFIALFLVFIGGILSSFTPCVYPIIPITVSYIGARAEGKKMRGFFLSLFFVFGLAIMYSGLGIIAALTGGVFGGLTQNPIVYGVLIAVFLLMGASMMGAFDLQLPAAWQGKLQSGQRRGILGAVFMGMASGLIAAPCVGPILVALLSWVAQTRSVLVGFGLLFSFSLGMGMLFIVIGTFAGVITALPKAGGWMDGIKHFFGWLLWGTAVFFAGYLLPGTVMRLIWGAFLLLLGIYIGVFKPSPENDDWRWMLRKWLGIMAVIGGLFLFLFGFSQMMGWSVVVPQSSTAAALKTTPDWIINDEEAAFARAAAEGKPVMMDFYADWCAACVELDHKTYNQPQVLDRTGRFICLKMDFTRQNEWSGLMTEKYRVKGMPTVIFFDSRGKEIERFVGFKNAEEVAAIMDRIK